MNILEIKALTKSFGVVRALNGLELVIPPGIIFGLIGPNGAGKTTIIRCVADLLDIDNGEIKIFGKNLLNDGIEIKKQMGILFENTESLFIHLKGEEHLQFVGEIYGLKKAEIQRRIDELFIFFELNDHRYKLIEEYSKGMERVISATLG